MLGLTPAFVIAATTSMDYVYGLFLFVAGWTVLERRGPAWCGGLLLGLAAASRLAYAPLGLVVVLLGPGRTRPVRRARRRDGRAGRGDGARLRAVAAASGDLSFLTAERPTGQGVAGVLGRAVFKGGDLLGLVGTVVAVLVAVLVVRDARTRRRPWSGEWWLLVLAGVQLVVWLWIPAEPSYLLPALVALLAWVARPGLPAAS